MQRVLEFLLGVDRVHLGEGNVELSFLSAWPAWAAFLALLAAALYVWSIYRRESVEVSPWARGLLVFLRFFVLLLVLGLIFEPVLVLLRNDVIRSSVVVLVDRSASMTVADTRDSPEQQRAFDDLLKRGAVTPARPDQPSRYDLVRAALRADGGKTLKALAKDQRVFLYAFADSPKLIERIEDPQRVDGALKLLDDVTPDVQRTAAARSIEAVLEQLAGQTVTGLVVLTDGRNTVSANTARLEEMARSRNVPLLVAGVGNTNPPKDAEVRRVTAERRAFVNEDVSIRAEVANAGYEGQVADLELRVKDDESRNVPQQVTLGPSGRPQTVEIRFKPDKAGKFAFDVQLKPLAGEFDPDNNTSLPFEIEVIDRKLKVLLVEDLPRWEYQYLKSALYRDPTILLSVVLNAADPEFAPEGSLPIAAFPAARDALFQYDVIILGDVNRRIFSTEHMKWIDDFVREKGGGLVFIAGERLQNPNGYAGTPLEALLPVEISDEQLAGEISVSWRPEITIEGSISPILRFERDLAANADAWRSLEGFYWYYRAKAPKPGAQVLLVQPDDQNPYSQDGKFPIMVIQRVGAGQVFFSATDDTWRWRKYTGRRYFNAFWIQLMRYLALPQEQATIEPSSLRYTLGEPAKIQLRVADMASLPPGTDKVKVTVSRDVPGETKPQIQEIVLTRPNMRLGAFEAEFTPEATGKYVLAADVATVRGTVPAQAEFVVAPSREEFLDPTRDEDFLKKIASATPAGKDLDLTQLSDLTDLLPSRNRTVRNDITDEIWDSPLALILIMSALTAEWILRKKYRML